MMVQLFGTRVRPIWSHKIVKSLIFMMFDILGTSRHHQMVLGPPNWSSDFHQKLGAASPAASSKNTFWKMATNYGKPHFFLNMATFLMPFDILFLCIPPHPIPIPIPTPASACTTGPPFSGGCVPQRCQRVWWLGTCWPVTLFSLIGVQQGSNCGFNLFEQLEEWFESSGAKGIGNH